MNCAGNAEKEENGNIRKRPMKTKNKFCLHNL
jgi:hypothetical protein